MEGQLYAEIARSKPAPQGICVANSAGKVLTWALSFDNESSIPKFLDHALARFATSPDSREPVTAERFLRFPGHKMNDVADNTGPIQIPETHSHDERCPAAPVVEPGTLVGKIIGRPLDSAGDPIAQTTRQEDYMEARFEVPVGVQRQLARTLADAEATEPAELPEEFARALVSHAFLGQLDVNPLGGRQTGGRTDAQSMSFFAHHVSTENSVRKYRLTGSSDVAGGPSAIGVGTDGRQWEHQVILRWEGYFDLHADRIVQLVVVAEGSERLRWGNQRFGQSNEPDVAHLMAGHPIDLDCNVRYALSAKPVAADVAGSREEIEKTPKPQDRSGPDSAQEKLHHLREAARHLRAAGVAELAGQLERQVRMMEQGMLPLRNRVPEQP